MVGDRDVNDLSFLTCIIWHGKKSERLFILILTTAASLIAMMANPPSLIISVK